MAKICKQKDQVWIENTVRAIHGKFTGFPFSWKCEICQVIGMLHSRKGKSKILPVTKEEFEKSCRRVGEEDFKNNKQ